MIPSDGSVQRMVLEGKYSGQALGADHSSPHERPRRVLGIFAERGDEYIGGECEHTCAASEQQCT